MRWWQIRKRNEDLERELSSDLEMEEEEQRENGASSEEARYAALRALGNLALIRERTHEAWGWTPVERLWQDVRFGPGVEAGRLRPRAELARRLER